MDITRAAAALLDVNVEEETIERLLCLCGHSSQEYLKDSRGIGKIIEIRQR